MNAVGNNILELVRDGGEIDVRSFTKAELEDRIRNLIEGSLESTDSGMVYLMLKQAEYAIEYGLEMLRERAFDVLGHHLEGQTQGSILGHKVAIAHPATWQYSPAVDDLKSRQKVELDNLLATERDLGLAKKVPGRGRITVTLKAA